MSDCHKQQHSRKFAVVGRVDDQREDDELLAATAAGDAEAFAAFYRRHVAELLAYLRSRVGSTELAADLAGEIFAAALLACRRYRPGEAPAVAWLLGIAANKLRESARRRRVAEQARLRLGFPALGFDDEDLARVEELASSGGIALELLEHLPPAQRDAVRAHVLEGREYGALAAEMRCSQQLLRQRVSRGLRRLKTMIEEQS